MDTTLEFAEHSLVATPDIEKDILSQLPSLRGSWGTPFIVNRPAGTVHSSFDNREYMNAVISPTVQRVLDSSK